MMRTIDVGSSTISFHSIKHYLLTIICLRGGHVHIAACSSPILPELSVSSSSHRVNIQNPLTDTSRCKKVEACELGTEANVYKYSSEG